MGRITPKLLQQDEPEEQDASSYFDPKAKKARLKKHRASKEGQKKRRVHQKKPKAQERRVAASVGGRRQGGSGALPEAKGDVRRWGDFGLLVEAKRVEFDPRTGRGQSIGVKAEWLTKITAEAYEQNVEPALAIQFDDAVMTKLQRHGVRTSTDWIAMPLSVLKRLLERLDES